MNQNVGQGWWLIRAASITGVPEAEVSTHSSRTGLGLELGDVLVYEEGMPESGEVWARVEMGLGGGVGVYMCTSVPGVDGDVLEGGH